jgi:hypothetical protein
MDGLFLEERIVDSYNLSRFWTPLSLEAIRTSENSAGLPRAGFSSSACFDHIE